jgi:hypothetical protein
MAMYSTNVDESADDKASYGRLRYIATNSTVQPFSTTEKL